MQFYYFQELFLCKNRICQQGGKDSHLSVIFWQSRVQQSVENGNLFYFFRGQFFRTISDLLLCGILFCTRKSTGGKGYNHLAGFHTDIDLKFSTFLIAQVTKKRLMCVLLVKLPFDKQCQRWARVYVTLKLFVSFNLKKSFSK